MQQREQIDVLREVFVEWMQLHELGDEFGLFTQDEWTRREGPNHFLKGADLILTFENGLYTLLNYPQEDDIEGELQDLALGFGYWFELGHSWNLGFYRDPDWPPLPPDSASYSEKLKDPRWLNKRKRILDRSRGCCEECGSYLPLEVHHCYYRYGRQVWQYPDGALLAVCRHCHERRAEIELRFRLFMPTVQSSDLELIRRALRHCQYWFPTVLVREFFEALENWPTSLVAEGEAMTCQQLEQRQFIAAYRFLRHKLLKMLKERSHPPDRGEDWPRNWL